MLSEDYRLSSFFTSDDPRFPCSPLSRIRVPLPVSQDTLRKPYIMKEHDQNKNKHKPSGDQDKYQDDDGCPLRRIGKGNPSRVHILRALDG